MDLCVGGELFEKVVEAGRFDEGQAAVVMLQIFRVVHYLHENHICHRDLKPENFVFQEKGAPASKKGLQTLKLIDFGLSTRFNDDTILQTKTGTPYYVAPQVLAGKYDQRCDIWSCGVIMYVLHCGYPPFYGEADVDVLSKVRLGNYSFNAADWKGVSDDAKNLIRMCLKMNPKDRFTAEQCLSYTWLERMASEEVEEEAATESKEAPAPVEEAKEEARKEATAESKEASPLVEETTEEVEEKTMTESREAPPSVEEVKDEVQEEGTSEPVEAPTPVEQVIS
jgi:calcium-dependent protein kinase